MRNCLPTLARPVLARLVLALVLGFGLVGFVCFRLGPSAARAEQVPIRNYDVRDGLAHSRVASIFQDHLGYLWFGTWEGLSRFDGYTFLTYGVNEGISNPLINSIAEDRSGGLWVTTWGSGLAHLPASSTTGRFVPHPLGLGAHFEQAYLVLLDGEGFAWCFTNGGLVRSVTPVDGVGDSLSFQESGLPRVGWGAIDANGFALIPTIDSLHVARGAQHRALRFEPALAADPAAIATDGERAYLATAREVYWFHLPEAAAAPVRPESLRIERLPIELEESASIRRLCMGADGSLWIGTDRGLIRYQDGSARLYTHREGLPEDFVRSLAEDRDGNLWIGTNIQGVSKYSGDDVVRFNREPGRADAFRLKIVQAADGSMYASGVSPGITRIVDGVPETVAGSDRPPFDNLNYSIVQDRRGDWWIGSNALYFVPGPDINLARAVRMGPREGMVDHLIIGIRYSEAEDRLWIAPGDDIVYVADLGVPGQRRFKPLFECTPDSLTGVRCFEEDLDRNLWVSGFHGLARFRDGRLRHLTARDGLPDLSARSLYRDRHGRMWIGFRFAGLAMTEDPEADRPRFRHWTTNDGLPSNTVWSITEDEGGRIYLATGRGLVQLDPESGEMRRFSTEDGLAGESVQHCLRDREGKIWLATSGGISRFDPAAVRAVMTPPPIYLDRAWIDGVPIPLPVRGAREVRGLTFTSGRDNLRLEFVGLRYRDEGTLRYIYQLDGADKGFGDPMVERSVNFARLAPGSYQFRVLAEDPEGRRSEQAALFAFRILPPVWRQSWFVTLFATLAVSVGFGVYRYRVGEQLRLERIRRQIALDLHDDIGSGLAQIAILSEVARRSAPPASEPLLAESAELARGMRESMSDIVWAVDPKRDRLVDLVQRMRQATANLIEAHGLSVEFLAPGEAQMAGISLAPDQRRHLLLVYKESITNVARHAAASRVDASLIVSRGELTLRVSDDGRGFDPTASFEGNGLRSLRQRALELGARLDLDSASGQGTRIRLTLPLRAKRRLPWRRRSES